MNCPLRKRFRSEPSGFKMVAVDGFSSWGEEEDLDTDMHSPTDASEDSVDVKVKPIPSLKSKRKCAEPRKFSDEVKKRRVDSKDLPESPFRPWSQETPSGYVPRGYPLPADQDEPLSLVLKDKRPDVPEKTVPPHIQNHAKSMPRPLVPPSILERLNPPANCTSRPRPQDVVRLHHFVERPSSVRSETESYHLEDSERTRAFSVESLISEPTRAAPSTSTSSSLPPPLDKAKPSATAAQQQQRNYKNMTRERRVEANARERTRVHTISAAFDTLRRAVPAYSHNQKLSKLSVLRIACSYILTLSRVAGMDYSEDNSEPPLADCVDHVTRTIQLEGKLRKKKDE